MGKRENQNHTEANYFNYPRALWVLLFSIVLSTTIENILREILKHFQKLSQDKVEIHRLRVEEARLKSKQKPSDEQGILASEKPEQENKPPVAGALVPGASRRKGKKEDKPLAGAFPPPTPRTRKIQKVSTNETEIENKSL